MKKAELRSIYKSKRMSLSHEEIQKLSVQIHVEFLTEINSSVKSIHVFLPIKKLNEPNIFLLLPQLWKLGIETYTSIVNDDNKTLRHVLINSSTEMTTDARGIPVPIQAQELASPKPDIILVPLLYCDNKGNRVGYGKGFYDQFLTDYKETKKYGIGFFEPKENIDDINELDIPLNALVLPTGIMKFAQ